MRVLACAAALPVFILSLPAQGVVSTGDSISTLAKTGWSGLSGGEVVFPVRTNTAASQTRSGGHLFTDDAGNVLQGAAGSLVFLDRGEIDLLTEASVTPFQPTEDSPGRALSSANGSFTTFFNVLNDSEITSRIDIFVSYSGSSSPGEYPLNFTQANLHAAVLPSDPSYPVQVGDLLNQNGIDIYGVRTYLFEYELAPGALAGFEFDMAGDVASDSFLGEAQANFTAKVGVNVDPGVLWEPSVNFLSAAAVPEPNSSSLVVAGLLLLTFLYRRSSAHRLPA